MRREFGRYRTDTLLARGGMGEVYLGSIAGAHGFARRVVIKVISGDLVTNERYAMMFVDEARIAAQLHHPNIVQTLDFDVSDGGVFLVTEYVAGLDMRALLKARQPPSYALATTIIAELATGLAAAHDACDATGSPLQIVHRDVSPSNVLLGVHGEVKLADFGVAKARSRSYQTVSGTIKGKVPFMAPEQIRGGKLDGRADIFALGVLLFELTTGTRLYSAGSNTMAMEMILRGDRPDPRVRRTGYPDALAAIVERALAFDRDDRYATASALVDDLDDLTRDQRWSRSLAALGAHVRAMSEHHDTQVELRA
ncbi:MAG TPA: serine/threonine-protein kinase [Kofleriaceae bacterium]|nr:serine/threonine-protein kinase [Kofleriaceae bacterium]